MGHTETSGLHGSSKTFCDKHKLTGGQCSQEAQGCAGDAKHVGQGEGDKDAGGDDQAGHNGALVAEGQAKDDVGGCAGAAGVAQLLQAGWMGGMQVVCQGAALTTCPGLLLQQQLQLCWQGGVLPGSNMWQCGACTDAAGCQP